jgi:O-antigen/teichoic acid export membrane protein
VALYKVGVELANKMRQIPIVLLGALMPAAADLEARKEHDRLQRLYVRATKYLAAVTVPLVAFTVGSAGPIMRTWMGPGYETSAWVLRIIAFGYLCNVLPGAGVSVALGMGRPGLQMRAGLIAMISNVSLTILLYLLIGFWGIPLGTAASMCIATWWFLGAMRAAVGVGTAEVLRTAVLWPALASVPGFLMCAAVDGLTTGLVGRAPNAGVLLASAAAFGLCYLAVIRRAPFLDAFDTEFLGETLALNRVPALIGWIRSARHGQARAGG